MRAVGRRHGIAVVLLLAGALAPVRAGAQQAATRLEEVTVTATRYPAPVLDVPQSVSIVSSTEIVDRANRTTPESLQEEVGILVQETNLGGGSPFIRGQTGNRILVLVDGVRLNNSTFRFGPNQYLNTVDDQQVDRIEIVRGPSSVLYGSDALGGVVNVITKRRQDFPRPFGVNARWFAQFGSAAVERTGRFETNWNNGPIGFQGGVTGRAFDDMRAGAPTGVQPYSGYSELDGDARLQWRIGTGHELAFAFARVTQYQVPNTTAWKYDNERFYFDPQERTLYLGEYRLAALPLGFENWRTTLSWQQQREVRRRQKRTATTMTRDEDDVGTVGVTSTLERPVLTAHRLTGGLEWYFDTVDSSRVVIDTATGRRTPGRSAFPDGSTYDTLGLFLQGTIDVNDLLTRLGGIVSPLPLWVVPGGRYSRFAIDSTPPGFGRLQRDFDDLTGSVGLRLQLLPLHPGLMLVGSWSQGFRAPNLDDTVVLRAVPEQGGVDVPNPTLGAERVTNWEGGLKAALPAGSGTLYYFHSDYSDLIERRQIGTEPGTNVKIFQRQNIGTAVVEGVEGELLVPVPRVSGLDLRGNFSWIYGRNRSAGEPFSRIPPPLGLGGLRYQAARLPAWVEFYGRVAGAQRRLSRRDQGDRRIPKGGTPGWYTLNLRGGWSPVPNFQVNLVVENMLDERYRLHGSGIDAPGINVAGNLTWLF